MKFLLISASVFICVLFSCQKKNIPIQSTSQEIDSIAHRMRADSISKMRRERRRPFPDMVRFKSFLFAYAKDSFPDHSSVSISLGSEIISMSGFAMNIYKANNYNGFWGDSSKCRRIIQLLQASRFDGLSPGDYQVSSLDSLFRSCYLVRKKKNDTLYYKLELTLTKNYLKYLSHLRFGKTNPEKIFKDWDYKRDIQFPYTAAAFSEIFLQNPDRLVKEFRPQYKIYELLREVLYKTDSLGQDPSLEWDAIPWVGKELKLGDTSWVIVKVKQRLSSVGFGNEDPLTNAFDEDLSIALKSFQEQVGLTPNDKIDKITLNKLNFTLPEIEDVVKVNMERCRWLLKGDLPDYFILVNIADYYLRIYKNGKVVYKTRVVVGAANKETPLFHSKMTTVEFNPYWTVPMSIACNEILPKLKTDPEFLSRNNMEVLQKDSVVQVQDFSSYTKNYFPFVIRQKPGPDNSLGVVKFLFPNPYFVYFHDTPSKSLFEKDVRAFSHGCIRVNNPLDLAAYLLSDQGFNAKKIDEIIKTGKNTGIVLKTKIPVMITYWTCFANEKGQVVFFKDIYGRDKLILKELNN